MSLFSYRNADSTYLYFERERVRVFITRLLAGRFRFIEQTARGAGMFSAGDTIHYRPLPAPHWEP